VLELNRLFNRRPSANWDCFRHKGIPTKKKSQ
jgi:hypothetical protein